MFGDAEHLERTAQHLAEKSEGNPGRLMELCEYLVHNNALRWIDGRWLLPQEIASISLPASREGLIEASLARLSSEARELGGRLSVIDGILSLELCAALSPLAPELLFPAINELAVDLRAYYLAGSIYAFGATEAWRDNSQALEFAERLEPQPLKLFQASADQIRAVYYGHQGNMRKARHARGRVDARALQRGMTWQVETWAPGSAILLAARQHDTMTTKRATGQLRPLAAETPDLNCWMLTGQATHLLLRGRYEAAIGVLEQALGLRGPLHVGHANLVAQLAQAYNALGRSAEAKAICEKAIAELAPDDLAYTAITLHVQVERALAESGLGQHDTAAAQLERLIADHGPNHGPLTLGGLHEARLGIALRAGDEPAAVQHLERMEHWYRSTDCSTLIQHCDRITKRWRKTRQGGNEAPYIPSISFLANIGSKLATSTVIQDSPQELLAQLVKGALAGEGVLTYAPFDTAPVLLKTRDGDLPDCLAEWIETRTSAAFTYSTDTEDAADGRAVDENAISFEGKTWRLYPLVADDAERETAIGAIALCKPLTHVPQDLLRVLGTHLHNSTRGTSADLSTSRSAQQ